MGRRALGSGGVVRDPALRRAALIDVGRAALALGVAVRGFWSSGLAGPKGNLETFIELSGHGADQGPVELEALATRAEPG